MFLTTLKFLVGNRAAIFRIAESNSTIRLGLFKGMVAGIAREFDQEYLPSMPIVLILPALVSLPLCLLFYACIRFTFSIRRRARGHGRTPRPCMPG